VGDRRIKRILRSRLPERLRGRLPPLAVEVGVGLGLTMLMALARLALVPWTGESAPFALVFVAVVGAALLAGWRSGLMALVAGQLLIWVFVMEPRGSFAAKEFVQVGALALATMAQLLTLAIVALYQREIDRAWSRRESQMDLLEKALKEIDHRTSNNYQTVLALILAQAKSARDPAVKDALQQVADRIRAIASASRKLAVASEGLEQVRIADHLQDLCGEVERGLARPGIAVHCHFDDLVLDADEAVCVSILVNELVTNALKHAFPDERAGTIKVALAADRDGLELTVADDGVGMNAGGRTRGGGLGTRLIETFARQLRARHEVQSDPSGTRHLVRIPPPKTQAARPRRSSRTSAIAPASMVES
jgi:two-component sensor histidine kinase